MKRQTTLIIITLLIAALTFSQEKKYAIYKVKSKETITSIARKLGITPYDLLKLNPDANDGIAIDEVLIIPNKNYKNGKVIKLVVEKPVVETQAKESIVVVDQDSIKDGVLYHTVKFQETLYSLSRKYKVKKKKIKKLNPTIKKNKISIGQVIKIPTDKEDTHQQIVEVTQVETKEDYYDKTKFFEYEVKSQETKYGLSKRFSVSIEDIENANPHIPHIKESVKVLDKILIPLKTEEIVSVIESTQPSYKIHIVQEKEGFFRLKQMYGVTKEEVLAANPEIIDGLKLGMEIKIPLKNKVKDDITEKLEQHLEGKKLNVVLMLPFLGLDGFTSFSNNKSLSNISDFYIGTMLALDSLKAKGLSVNMKVFNTKANPKEVSKILTTNDFSNVDVVIGPLIYSNVKLVSTRLQDYNIPVISPVTKKDHQKINVNNVVQNVPTNMFLQQKMLNYIKHNYNNQNLVLIADEDKKNETKVKEKVNSIVAYLKQHDSIKKVTVLRMKKGDVKDENYEKNILKNKENWVVLVSDSISSVVVNDLGVLPEDFKITLFALKKETDFDRRNNLFLNRLQLHYPSTNFIDKKDVKVNLFIEKFKATYKVAPSKFVFKGYDTTYDALLRVATLQEFDLGKTQQLFSKYNYNNTKHFKCNEGIFIVKYSAFEKVEVD
jgi:LysM repeat protein